MKFFNSVKETERFPEYNLVLREVEPEVFIIVSFNAIHNANKTNVLRKGERLIRQSNDPV